MFYTQNNERDINGMQYAIEFNDNNSHHFLHYKCYKLNDEIVCRAENQNCKIAKLQLNSRIFIKNDLFM